MKAEAKLNYLRIAPRKVRLVADMVRGRKASDAKAVLGFSLKKGAQPIMKLLDSAIANAKNNLQMDEDSLVISKIVVDGGPILKRWRARSRGRANQIQKKTSHITLVLEGKKITAKKAGKKNVGVKQPVGAKRVPAKTKSSNVQTGAKTKTIDTQEQEAKSAETTEAEITEPKKKGFFRFKKERGRDLKNRNKASKKIFRRKSF